MNEARTGAGGVRGDRPLRVRKVHSLRTFLWLAKGWSDFMDSPLVGLVRPGRVLDGRASCSRSPAPTGRTGRRSR